MLSWVSSPLNLAMRSSTYYLMWDHASTHRRLLGLLNFMKLLSWSTHSQHVRYIAHDYLFRESRLILSRYLSHWSNFFSFITFPLEVSETIIPLYYSFLLNKLCTVPFLWTHLLDYNSSLILLPPYPSRLNNMLNLLYTSIFYECVIPVSKWPHG